MYKERLSDYAALMLLIIIIIISITYVVCLCQETDTGMYCNNGTAYTNNALEQGFSTF